MIAAIVIVIVLAAVATAGALRERGDAGGEFEVVDADVEPSGSATPWPAPRPGTWRRLPPAPLSSRVDFTMLWTDDRAFVWGGFDALGRPRFDGATFDPRRGVWRPLPPVAARDASATAVLAGSDVVLVSASDTHRYHVAQRRWRPGPVVPLPPGHGLDDRVMAYGDTVVVVTEPWDRSARAAVFSLGADADAWMRLPDVPVALSRVHVILRTGSQLLVIGPASDGGDTALALDLADTPGTWYAVRAPSLPDALVSLAGASTDRRIVLWGTRRGTGAGAVAFAAIRDRGGWRRIATAPLRPARTVSVLWAGDQVVVWNRADGVGASLDPALDRWTSIPPAPAVGHEVARRAVWTGDGLLTWGALGTGGALYALP